MGFNSGLRGLKVNGTADMVKVTWITNQKIK
jgi:hypothetical protein